MLKIVLVLDFFVLFKSKCMLVTKFYAVEPSV